MSTKTIEPLDTTITRPAGPATDGFQVASIITVVAFAFFCLAPFWLVVASSITEESDLIMNGYTFFPQNVSFESYITIFSRSNVGQAYFASTFITLVGTFLAVVATTGIAYVISLRLPRISSSMAVLVYIPMLFSGGLVPLYILVTQILHLNNTYWSVILPILMSPFFVFIMVAFFRGLPRDILDSARIDGASELRIMVSIVLPLAKPIVATIALFYALNYWNEWFTALLFISDNSMYPLQLLLQNLIGNVDAAQAIQVGADASVPIFQMRSALVVITIGPIILAYPFVQKYFVYGLTLGGTKG